MACTGSLGHPSPCHAADTQPCLITPRSLERTGFQEASPYRGTYDLRTDFVMAYGLDRDMAGRVKRWIEAGYVPHVMTGITPLEKL